MLRVHLRTLDKMVQQGLLTTVMRGRKGYFYRTDVTAVLQVFDGRTDFASTTNLAMRAFVRAETCEKKLAELLDMLGFTTAALGTEDGEIERLYMKAKEYMAIEEPVFEAAPLFYFAKSCLATTEHYFALVGQRTHDAEPWRPFLEATQKLCELAPRKIFNQDQELASAYGYLEAARRHVRATSYFFVRATEGRKVAHEAFIGGSAFDPIIPLLYPH
jgi:hypothetical protein